MACREQKRLTPRLQQIEIYSDVYVFNFTWGEASHLWSPKEIP